MRIKPLFAVCAAMVVLGACAKPTTVNPTYSADEFRREQAAQAATAERLKNGTPATAPDGNALYNAAFDSSKKYTETEIDALAVRLDPLATRIEQAASQLCREMRGPKANCAYQVLLDAKEVGLNAHADGKNVVINPAMVDFAKNDTHLAFVIAHEFAHNIMAHIAAQQKNVAIGGILGSLGDALVQSQGLNTQGALGKIGAQQAMLKYSPAFETEADYVGLYILARAGYPFEQAPDFWRIMSMEEPRSIYVTSTHPNNPSRTLAMEKTIAEIRAKQATGQPLLPNIRPNT